jgi:hypothetical protein
MVVSVEHHVLMHSSRQWDAILMNTNAIYVISIRGFMKLMFLLLKLNHSIFMRTVAVLFQIVSFITDYPLVVYHLLSSFTLLKLSIRSTNLSHSITSLLMMMLSLYFYWWVNYLMSLYCWVFSWYKTDGLDDLFIVYTLLMWLDWFLGLLIGLAIPDEWIHCWGCYFG